MVLKLRIHTTLHEAIISFHLKDILDIHHLCDNHSIFMKSLDKDKVPVVLKAKKMITHNDQLFFGVGSGQSAIFYFETFYYVYFVIPRLHIS